nr:SDR family NAD(P)-dependent oxidoreductase [uncultured Fretibacterium sp.]
MLFALNGKVAVVTGAGSLRGIGRSIAIALATQGAKVAICDINEEGLLKVAEEIKQRTSEVMTVTMSVTDGTSIREGFASVVDKWGKIDILVNNAGITQPVTVAEMSETDFERILDVNLKGTYLCCKAVAPYMLEKKYGRIINMSSVSAKRGGGVFGGAHYSAAKAGILGFSKAFAREVSPHGITVNSIAPGLVATDIRGGLESEEEQKRMTRDIPCRRMGLPEEVAAAVCFLASDEAGYITGEEIDVNGGSHMD